MVLLDTCTLLWLAADQSKLTRSGQALLRANAEALWISAISAFELAVKHRKHKLTLPLSPREWYSQALAFHGVKEIPVTGRIAARSVELPERHNDPCDRIIIATALEQGMTILTPDHLVAQYEEAQTAW
jgi:PIN domain nuclease of toxin-antitoxin system